MTLGFVAVAVAVDSLVADEQEQNLSVKSGMRMAESLIDE